jgi:hypothetical protein
MELRSIDAPGFTGTTQASGELPSALTIFLLASFLGGGTHHMIRAGMMP